MALGRSAVAVGLAVVALAACTRPRGDADGGTTAPGPGAPAARGCASGSFRVAGPPSQQAALERWAGDYRARCGDGVTVTFAASDPVAGSALFRQGVVAILGSDAPLGEVARSEVGARCRAGRMVSLPLLLTPLTLAYRLSGVPQLALTPVVLARIYTGVITSWNDPDIAAANPGVELPNRPVRPVHRSAPATATTAVTTLLQARAEGVWNAGASAAWPAAVGLGAGSADAVARTVAGTDGSLGYLEADVAKRAGLARAWLDSGSGPVAPSADSAGRAASAAAVRGDGRNLRLDVDYGLEEPDAYPLLLVSYLVSCTEGVPAEQARFVKTFLAHAGDEGQRTAAELGHVPLPPRLRTRVRQVVESLPGS